jgi:DtxR family Mn-dependent transcriptional regulator
MVQSTHPPVEEYLQMIAFFGEEGVPAVQAQLAKRLGKTAAAVSEVVVRLEADGYLVRNGRVIELTDKGREVAMAVIRRHRLSERLLVDVIGIPWAAAHIEAGRWEHVISETVEEHLVELLGDPATCPHGNPIPGSGKKAPERRDLMLLSEVERGRVVRVERITEAVEQDQSLLEFLAEMGFVPGERVKVIETQPDGTVTLEISGTIRAVGPAMSCRLLVGQGS